MLSHWVLQRPEYRLAPVHSTPEESEKRSFILRSQQMFSVRTAPEEFKNAQQLLVDLCLKKIARLS